jgi:anti-sigma B factor antagonist
MNTTAAKILVMTGEKFACIKISGRANFTSSIEFRTLFDELRQRGFGYFVLDLSDCTLMDSTFLGVLAGLGVKINAGRKDPCDEAIELFNSNARITDLLENLGILHLFRISQGAAAPAGATDVEALTAAAAPSKAEMTRACLEAHQTLMEINPANVPKFKEVAQFLADDLKKIKAAE